MQTKKTWVPLAVAASLMVASGMPLTGQVAVGGQTYCPRGVIQGDLGVSGLSCEGECTLVIQESGREESWSFTTEPSIIGVQDDGPADGILRVGDRLVAIDGILITTREGGRRYANLRPGETVSVRYRRDGRIREATIRVASRCLEVPEPVAAVGRAVPPEPPEEVAPLTGVVVAPRIVVSTPSPVARVVEGATNVATTLAPRITTGLLGSDPPTGKLGVGFSCRVCGTQTDEESGEEVWFFSGPLEVTAVTPGGPADDAGIQRGDLIKAIEGNDLDTDEGGLAFSHLTPGERVRLTVVGRDGSERQVSVTPEEANAPRILSGRVPAPSVGVPDVAEPSRPAGVETPSPQEPRTVVGLDRGTYPAPAIEPPADLPFRYSGGLWGVDVEVWGAPVSVSEMRGARTLIINADGLWIRITVPRGGAVGSSSLSGGAGGESGGVSNGSGG